MDNICFSASKYYYVCIRVGVCGVCTTYVSDASFVSPVCLYAEYIGPIKECDIWAERTLYNKKLKAFEHF